VLLAIAMGGCEVDSAKDVRIIPFGFPDVDSYATTVEAQYQGGGPWKSIDLPAHLPSSTPQAISLRIASQQGSTAYRAMGSGTHIMFFLGEEKSLEDPNLPQGRVRLHALAPSRGGAPSLLAQDPLLWTRLPVPVSIEVPSDQGDFEPKLVHAATAQVRRAVSAINESAGIRLFDFTGERSASHSREGVVVSFEDLAPPRLGATRVYKALCSGSESAMPLRCGSNIARTATVRLSWNAPYEVVLHELMHAVGLQHTCVVPSVMATEFSSQELQACAARRHALHLMDELVLRREFTVYDVAAIRLTAAMMEQAYHQEANHAHWVSHR
jgi:hypothetical protein